MAKDKIKDLKQFIKEYSFPTDILVETISLCNLNCIMCPQDKLSRATGRISFNLWKKIIDEVAEVSPGTRIWPALMGEPLLMGEEIFKLLRYATGKGLDVHLNTNMRAFKKEMTEELLGSGIKELLIGLDGASKKSYETIRKKGNYEKLIDDVKHIIDCRNKMEGDTPSLTLQFIVMQENEHEVDIFKEFWQKNGKNLKLKIKPRTGWADSVDVWYGENGEKISERIPCTWLLRQMTVMWNGDIPCCDGDWNGNFIAGNAYEYSLSEVWTGPLKELRDRHLVGDFTYPICSNCKDWQAGRSDWIEID